MSIRILKEKSKDIRVLSFLSFSYLKSGSWEQFSDVFDGLGTLVERNYDALFPDRDRARQLAFKWLGEERFTILLNEKKPPENDYVHITRLLSGLTKIKPVLEQKFPDGSPFPSILFKCAQQWERACKPKSEAETPPPAAAQPVARPPAAEAAGAPAASVQKPPAAPTASAAAETIDTPKQAQLIIRKAALIMIEKERARAAGYRIMRSVRWDILDTTPPAENGKIRLEGPNQQQRTYFQKLFADKDWKTLLEKGEAAFSSGANHLWLDLQRLIATACKELGADYTQVHNAILTETALFLKRVPDLTGLSFADGTPCCDDATKDWIATAVTSATVSEKGASAPCAAADPLIEEQRSVNTLASAGQIEEAIALVQKAMHSSSIERDNFRRTVTIGTLLLKAKQPDIATSILETLDQKIDRYNLDKWDPAIAVEAWTAQVMAYKAVKIQKPQNIQALLQDKITAVLGKIGQTDPGKAFALSKNI